MKNRIISVLLILTLAFSLALSACGKEAKSLSDGVEADENVVFSGFRVASDSYSDFAGRLLFQSFEKAGQENTLVSPLSVALSLALAAEGAEGETLEEIENALGMDIEELRKLAASYLSDKEQLKVANSMWINEVGEFSVNKDFLERNAAYHKADVFTAPFGRQTVKEINAWVNEKTDGMIEDIINSLDARAVMCLVNALVFEAEWRSPYEEYQVKDGSFVTEKGERQKAQFLCSNEGCYLEDEYGKGFLKYYDGFDYAFVAMLPDEGVSVEEYLMALNVESLLNNVEYCSVNARLPKFESEFDIDLKSILKSMGMEKAFDEEKADFSKLGQVQDGNIWIGDVLHKTRISVTERGTKAGAATAVILYGNGAMEEPKELYLERPFVYMIVDTEKNIPVFMGTVMELSE